MNEHVNSLRVFDIHKHRGRRHMMQKHNSFKCARQKKNLSLNAAWLNKASACPSFINVNMKDTAIIADAG